MLDYIVRYDGRQLNLGGAWALQDDLLEEEAGAFGSYSFTLAPTHPMCRPDAFTTEDPSKEVTFSERYADGTEAELFRGWVKKTSLGDDLLLTVECEGMLAYLQSTVVRPYACRPATDLPDGTEVITQDPFEWLIYQHNEHCPGNMQFDVGFNPRVGAVAAGTGWNSTWDELNDKFCSGLDRYLHGRTGPTGRRIVDLLDGGAGEGTQTIVLGENIVSMDISGESSEIVTAIVPRATIDDSYNQERGERIARMEIGIGDADLNEVVGNASTIVRDGDRMVNWRMVDAYGFREEKRDYEATSPETLAQLAAADLDPTSIGERTANAIEVSAIDLHAANPSVQPIRLLEWDRVFVRAYGLEDDGSDYGIHSGGRLILDQWLPCSRLHISSVHPEDSWYRFGDLPQTMTRMSALRMGMLRRGNGTLVRRTDGTEWDNDRSWNHANEIEQDSKDRDDELWQGIQDATDQWAQHLDEQFDTYTQQWYESLDEVSKADAQGREELMKHLDEVEGKWSDELGAISGEVDGLASTVDENHRTLLDGIRDVARNAQRTFFGVCDDGGSARAVPSSELTRPGGEEFALEKGVVVDVLMDVAWSAPCNLSIGGTASRRVRTNGFDVGIWQAGEVVRFLYDGTYWQSCSTDIYGSSLIIGNPSLANFYTNGREAGLTIDGNDYWHVGVTGQTVGFVDRNHVDINSEGVDVINTDKSYVHFGIDSSRTGGALIRTKGSLYMTTVDNASSYILLSQGDTYVHGNRVMVDTNQLYLVDGSHAVIQRSVVVQVSGTDYYDVNMSAPCNFYAWVVTNGDYAANDAKVVGTSFLGTNARYVRVHFDKAVTGHIRLNMWGFYCKTQAGDEPGEGPEVFGDEAGPGPSALPGSTENTDEGAI